MIFLPTVQKKIGTDSDSPFKDMSSCGFSSKLVKKQKKGIFVLKISKNGFFTHCEKPFLKN